MGRAFENCGDIRRERAEQVEVEQWMVIGLMEC